MGTAIVPVLLVEDVRAQQGTVVLKFIQLAAGRIKVLIPHSDLSPPPSPASQRSVECPRTLRRGSGSVCITVVRTLCLC